MKSILILCLTILTLGLAENSFAHPFDAKVKLTAGTNVFLETTEKIHSRQVSVGQSFKFKVQNNVIIDGRIAIASGTLAIGRVKSINKSTYNNPEEVLIEVTSVQAVDGQQVILNGAELSIKGMYSGQGTTVNSGLTITANVMNDIIVKARK